LTALPPDLAALFEPFCVTREGPGPGPFQAVGLEGVRAIARRLEISPVRAMVLCLEHDIWPLRFARNRGVFSAPEQRRLLESCAAIIGCGGLGGHVATLLARAGVGAFTLCDDDVFDESNLNRQVLCRETALGQNKALVAQEELAAIASHTLVRAFPVAVDPDNLPEILRGASVVVDCLDRLATRRFVGAAADVAGIPFIHGAVAGYEGFAMLIWPGEKSLESLYPVEERSPEDAFAEGDAEFRLGVPALTPAGIAALQAGLALQVLTGKRPDGARLCHLDIAGPTLEVLAL